MRRALVVLALFVAWPAVTEAGNLTLRAGAFFPRGDSNLFTDAYELYTPAANAIGTNQPPGVDMSDWVGFTGGVEYNFGIGSKAELGFSIDGYGRSIPTAYRDFTRDDGSEILQQLKLTIVPVGMTFRLLPTGGKGRVVPYLAVGADAFFYTYEAYGDFIDFYDPAQPVLYDYFYSSAVAPGFHVAAGLRFPMGHDFSLVGEYRYQWAQDDMDDDFSLNRIDLSGASVTLGFNIKF